MGCDVQQWLQSPSPQTPCCQRVEQKFVTGYKAAHALLYSVHTTQYIHKSHVSRHFKNSQGAATLAVTVMNGLWCGHHLYTSINTENECEGRGRTDPHNTAHHTLATLADQLHCTWPYGLMVYFPVLTIWGLPGPGRSSAHTCLSPP